MKVTRYQMPALYLRKDPDSGWTLAIWKWRVFFSVIVKPRSNKVPE